MRRPSAEYKLRPGLGLRALRRRRRLGGRGCGITAFVRVVVVGATGNVGTSVLRALADEPQVESIVGIARRLPRLEAPKTEWVAADIVGADLVELFRGADAVVHLAWLIQPGHDRNQLWRVNVEGSTRVLGAVAGARVPVLVYASSVGAYSPGPENRRVDESWPTHGIPSSFYSRHKAEVERRLDRFESDHPRVRTVRLRPGLIFKREAATGIRRLFAGPLLPSPLFAPTRIAVIPDVSGLRFQGVHSLDVADAYRRALISDARGAFNVAAEPVLDPPALAEILGAKRVQMSATFARATMALSFRLHLQPSEPGWLDLALAAPLLDTTRARTELGWKPRYGADDALRELLTGISESAGTATPPLDPATSGPLRAREFLTALGRKGGV
jgi:UDP-glucose 4-epimerase